MPERPVVRSIDFAALPAGRLECRLRAAELPDGGGVDIPVTVLTGRSARPRLCVVAGVHGNEFPGPLAVQQLSRELDPAQLAGTVVLVPIANPLAFNAGTRSSPDDGLNLNRVFPGGPDGTLTQRVAWTIAHEAARGADLVLDLHSGDGNGVMLPMAGFRRPPDGASGRARAVARASAEAAAACGLEMFWLMAWAPGTLSTALNELGVPAVGAEIGGAGVAEPAEVEAYAAMVRRCLRHLEIAGPPLETALPAQAATMEDVPAPASGLLDLSVSLRAEVAEGDLLGEVRDPWGGQRGALRAPFSGRVVHVRRFRQVRTGETALSLSRLLPNPVL